MQYWRFGVLLGAAGIAVSAVPSVAADKDMGGGSTMAVSAVKDEKSGEITLANEKVRVRFHKPGPGQFKIFPLGYSGYTIDLKDGEGWTPMATAPYFSCHAYRSGWGRDWLGYVVPRDAEIVKEGDAQKVTISQKDFYDFDGGLWDFTFSFSLKPGSSVVDVTYSAKVNRKSKLLLLMGPRLYAGEGSFGDKKDEALFSGLEYLGASDRSSANSALAPDAQMYFVPHPAKITIPLMAVVKDKKMVGLMWEPNQKWNGKDSCPSALFASPNWIEDKPNHLMGLFLPSCPDYVPENGLRAHVPYEMAEGETVTLKARIFAAEGGHVTDAIDLYLAQVGGVPEPQAWPKSKDDSLEVLVKGLTSTAWDAEKKGWVSDVGGGVGYFPSGIVNLVEAASLVNDQDLAKRAREIADQALTTSGRPIQLALRVGGVAQALEGSRGSAQHQISKQKPNGAWGYTPSDVAEGGLDGLHAPPSPNIIAPDGLETQGITAGELAGLFRHVLITNDQEALKAGIKGLESLEAYSIPFPYNNPECPQSPSLHGSYFGLRAYLAAYKVTGEKKYLEKAVYWAKTGLPFIYLWSTPVDNCDEGYIHCEKKLYLKGSDLYDNPRRDAMLYGSLYGYGSSQYSHHWYGLLVQWIGLVYADDLLDLSEHDKSLPWKKIADGLVRSCVWQMSDKDPYTGYWPDAFSVERYVPSGPWFWPGRLAWTFMNVEYGKCWEPETVVVRDGARQCHISSAADITDVKYGAGKLTFKLMDADWPASRAVVTGMPEKIEVTLDGKVLAKSDDLEARDECWSRGPVDTVLVKVRREAAPRTVEIRY